MARHEMAALVFLVAYLTASAAALISAEDTDKGMAKHFDGETAKGGNILLMSIFGRGHTGPAMALTLELASRGYHVTFAVPYRKGIADHFLDDELFAHPNVTFLALPTSDVFADLVGNDFRMFTGLSQVESNKVIFKALVDGMPEVAVALRRHISEHMPDLFIADTGAFAGIIVAKEFPDIPFVRLSPPMHFLGGSTSYFPFLGLDFPFPMKTWQRYVSRLVTIMFQSDAFFWMEPFATVVKQLDEYKFGPLRSFKDFEYGPVIIQSMLGLQPPHPIHPGHTLCGAITFQKELVDIPDDLHAWLEERKRVVYVTATTAHPAPTEFWDAMVKGLGSLQNTSVLLTARGLNKDRLPAELPANMRVMGWAPGAALLMHSSVIAVINSGGMNTISESITAGLPQIIVPWFADQFLNAASIQRAGAGLRLNGRNLTPADVKDAVERVTGEASFREQVKRLRMIQKAHGGVNKAADTAELYLNLGAKGMKLLEDVTKDMPWHVRTGAEFVIIKVAFVFLILWASLECLGFRLLITLARKSSKSRLAKAKTL